MVGSSTLQVFAMLALGFVFILYLMKLIVQKTITKGGTEMKKKHVHTPFTTLTLTTEVFYDFSVSFGAGYLGATVPSIAPSQLHA